MNLIIKEIIFALACSACITSAFIAGVLFHFVTDVTTVTNVTTVTESTPLYLQIAKDVANASTYELDVYNCRNFSMNLVNNLTEVGYKAETVSGWASFGRYCEVMPTDEGGVPLSTITNTSCAGPHMWVRMWDEKGEIKMIEAITGDLIED